MAHQPFLKPMTEDEWGGPLRHAIGRCLIGLQSPAERLLFRLPERRLCGVRFEAEKKKLTL